MGDLSLDRGRRLDRFRPLSHRPRILLYGFLGDLADSTDLRDAWRRILRAAGKSEPPPDRFAEYPLENKLYHGAILAAGLAAILTGVFMMSRIRNPFFPRNPYLFSDMTWGMMYVLHGLAGIGLIALIMVHVYFGLRPEKRPITKSMIFGWMSRDFYLQEHDPKRWVVETSSPPSSTTLASSGLDGRGLTDAG
jgi:cytochrome b subunit of formate dehydrogenase